MRLPAAGWTAVWAMAALALLAPPVLVPAGPAGARSARAAEPLDSLDASADLLSRPAPGGDASTLYNAGTVALERGDVGPAVAFLVAAKRLEPRASDIRANLEHAEEASLRLRGGDIADQSAFSLPALLSAQESWWLASALLACGALLSILSLVWRIPARARVVAPGLLAAGLLVSIFLHIRAWEESSHPEAVVIRPALSVERGPGEPSRAAVLLGSGERVRLGALRGAQAEIRIGGNSIGWADREGLWKVVETPRYTSQYAKR
jgi:hypothetical protein